MVDINSIFNLSRAISDSQWDSGNGPPTLQSILNVVVARAVQGQYSAIFRFPPAITAALIAEQNKQVVDLPDNMYLMWKDALNKIFDEFNESNFKIENVKMNDNGQGFKISWKDTPEESSDKKAQAAKIVESLINDQINEKETPVEKVKEPEKKKK